MTLPRTGRAALRRPPGATRRRCWRATPRAAGASLLTRHALHRAHPIHEVSLSLSFPLVVTLMHTHIQNPDCDSHLDCGPHRPWPHPGRSFAPSQPQIKSLYAALNGLYTQHTDRPSLLLTPVAPWPTQVKPPDAVLNGLYRHRKKLETIFSYFDKDSNGVRK